MAPTDVAAFGRSRRVGEDKGVGRMHGAPGTHRSARAARRPTGSGSGSRAGGPASCRAGHITSGSGPRWAPRGAAPGVSAADMADTQGRRTDAGRRRPMASALYVVDLKRFREMAAGDQIRGQYNSLSGDPNSLANLDQVCPRPRAAVPGRRALNRAHDTGRCSADHGQRGWQDLPNHMQMAVPIFSLPQEWLWCETWCSDATLKTAKTIDLVWRRLVRNSALAPRLTGRTVCDRARCARRCVWPTPVQQPADQRAETERRDAAAPRVDRVRPRGARPPGARRTPDCRERRGSDRCQHGSDAAAGADGQDRPVISSSFTSVHPSRRGPGMIRSMPSLARIDQR